GKERGRLAMARPLQRWLATARPSVGVVGCCQGPCRGDCMRPGPPATVVPATSPQRGSARRGTACGHGTRPPTRCRLRTAAPVAGVATNGAHRCRLRRGDDDDRRKAIAMARVSVF
ncbi:hypothetical protein GW17_00058916, partial [Ensete ventricosum]